MADDADQREEGNGVNHSTIMRAAAAAAATGVAAYGVRRLRGSHEDEEAEDDETDDGDDSEGGDGEDVSPSKREELTQALTTKVADAKKAASKLKPSPGRRSTLDTAWDAASEHLLPVAGDAASSLGESVAKKAPGFVRDELIPRFIEGFQRESS